ncbi:MAG: hypothetical protein H6Q90_5786 [Deltaproteobacteria bacterium]|nr:hypothetical protein [Deltaproteobacteria bacterium]
MLATDGLPNGCGDSTQASVAAAAASYAAGIPLFVLAINETSEHFQDLANAGAGVQPGQPNAPYFIGNNPQDLVTAFNSIIGGAISCDLTITGGTVDTAAGALGTVVLNGQPLVYGVDWILVDGTTIQLTGAACTELKSTPTPTVDASFPCGSVLL